MIRSLTPGNWVGEYLRNLVAEGRGGARRPLARSKGLIVRGSEPEEAPAPGRPAPRRFGRTRGSSTPQPDPATQAPRPAPAPAPERPLSLPAPAKQADAFLALNVAPGSGARSERRRPTPGTRRPRPRLRPKEAPQARVEDAAAGPGEGSTNTPIQWQILETDNYRIFHRDLELARRAAEVAESVRTAQAKRWASPASRSSWSPRCDLYLYPTAQSYAQGTGQPEVSPGISTMSNNGVRVLSRRMNLRADNPLFLTTTLPHEVTHIVLADVFIAQQIPRWADEGIAVLAEPLAEQRSREAELQEPLESGRIFQVGQLMAMDYPDQKDWRLFYAQSVSLTRFLVDQGPPERFIQFVRDSQRIGTATALRDVYQIEGLTELQDRWVTHAQAGRRRYGIEAECRFADVVGHAVIAGIPSPNSAGSSVYASTTTPTTACRHVAPPISRRRSRPSPRRGRGP